MCMYYLPSLLAISAGMLLLMRYRKRWEINKKMSTEKNRRNTPSIALVYVINTNIVLYSNLIPTSKYVDVDSFAALNYLFAINKSLTQQHLISSCRKYS